MTWPSFTELDKLWSTWSDWLVVCDCGFSLSALWCPLSVPTVLLGFLLPWMWGISSQLLQQSAATASDLWRRVAHLGCICAPSCRCTGCNNRQIWPWSTEWSRVKANRVLPRKRTGYSKHLPTTQEKTLHVDIIIMVLILGQHQNQIDYILCSQKWRLSIQSAKIR